MAWPRSAEATTRDAGTIVTIANTETMRPALFTCRDNGIEIKNLKTPATRDLTRTAILRPAPLGKTKGAPTCP